jgi:CheY-like chemotaxis protein
MTMRPPQRREYVLPGGQRRAAGHAHEGWPRARRATKVGIETPREGRRAYVRREMLVSKPAVEAEPSEVDAGWEAQPLPPPRPTPWPTFDLAAYARDSDTNLLAEQLEALDKLSTAPPPAFHPASVRPRHESHHPREATELVAAPLRARILECAERAHLLRTQLRIGGLTREEASRALTSELTAVETEANDLRAPAIGALMSALRGAVEELGGISGQARGVQFDVVVLDDEATRRARVALAVESLGHVARGANTLTELSILAAERMPDVIFVAATLEASSRHLDVCTLLREVVRSESLPVVVFAAATGARLYELARAVGAERSFSADFEIEAIMEQLTGIFGELLL